MSRSTSSVFDGTEFDSDLENHEPPLFQNEPPDLRPTLPLVASAPMAEEIWYPYPIPDDPVIPITTTSPPSYHTDPPLPPGVSPPPSIRPMGPSRHPSPQDTLPPRANPPPRARSPTRTPPHSPARRRRHSPSRVRQAVSLNRSGSNSTHTPIDDPIDLVRALEFVISEQNIVTEFNEISTLCEDLLDIVFDSVHQMFTNLPVFDDNFRRPEVDRLMQRYDVGGLILQKFEVVARVAGVHPDAESRTLFNSNFLQLTRGLQSVKSILSTLHAKMIDIMPKLTFT